MPEMAILQDLALIFAGSALGLYVCIKLKMPPIVGFLLAGFAIGPHGLGLVSSTHEVEILAEIGIVLLLFTIGIEFSVKDLLRSRRAVLLGGSLQVVLTIGVTILLASGFGVAPNRALFAGFLVSLSSTAIVLRALQDRADLDSVHGRFSLSVLIFQDIAIAPMVILTPLLADGSGLLPGSIIALIARAVVVVVLVIVLTRWLVPMILNSVVRTRSRELFLFSVALICIVVALVTKELGLSLGLGAFLAGLIISESEYSLSALDGVLPFKTVFTGFFFVSIGMLLDTAVVIQEPLIVFGLGAGVMLVKAVVVVGVALLLGLSSRTAIIAGIALCQVGEFSFILSKVGLTYDLLTQETYQIFLACSVITMAVTPSLINHAPSIADRLATLPGLRAFKNGSYRWTQKSVRPGSGLKDHLVIIGYGLNGQNVARAAIAAGIPFVAIEMNPATAKESRAKGSPVLYGDATSTEMLHEVSVARARVVVIAISDPVATRSIVHVISQESPNAHIIVRTRFVSEIRDLRDLGAQEVIPEEFETSVEIFVRVLRKYLVPQDEIQRLVTDVRSGSYEMFRSLGEVDYRLSDMPLSSIEISSVRVGPECNLAGRSLAETDIRRQFGVTVLAVWRGGKLLANPDGDMRLEADDVLYIAGKTDQCAAAATALTK